MTTYGNVYRSKATRNLYEVVTVLTHQVGLLLVGASGFGGSPQPVDWVSREFFDKWLEKAE